jgi:hypothetical protein
MRLVSRITSVRPGASCSLLWLMVLAGCTTLPLPLPRSAPPIISPEPLALAGVEGCGRGQLIHLVGKPFTALAAYQLPGHLRVLRPGQGITRDVMPDRLNAQVTANGAIQRLFCG